MTIVYTILGVMFVLFFFHLPTVPDDDDDEDERSVRSHTSPIRSPVKGVSINDNSITDKEKKFNFSASSSGTYPVLSPAHSNKGMTVAPPLSDSDGTILVSSGGSYGSINHPSRRELTSSQSSIDLKHLHLRVFHSLMKTLKLGKQLLREETVLLLAMMNFALLAQLINEVSCKCI